jgi:ABC-type transport system involved in cytochrome bd biosynthesis fused ATPase/permease subunit
LSWFDSESHAPGILTTVFSENVSTLNGLTTEVLCTVTEAVLAVIFGVIFGLFICWQYALLILVLTPIILVGVVAVNRIRWENKGGQKQSDE